MLDPHPLRSLEERGWGATRRSAGSGLISTRHEQQPRRPHLVLKRAKLGSGPALSQKRIPKRSELVFLQPSPNYCEPDLAQGSLGTQGRYCNRTSRGELIFLIKFLFFNFIYLNDPEKILAKIKSSDKSKIWLSFDQFPISTECIFNFSNLW